MKMPAKVEQKQVLNEDHDSAVQTAITGSTVYSLPKRPTSNQNMVDIVLMIINDDGPIPMWDMKPAKKTRNAADQFYDEHQEEYEARGQSTHNQVDWVNAHNKASPKLYDELEKRRSIAQVGMDFDNRHGTMRAEQSSNGNIIGRFDPTCPKCIKRKKRLEEQQRKKKGKMCKKCKEQRNRKDPKSKLERVTKRKIPKPKSRYRSFSKTSKPSIVCSNKCFQCYLTAETKTVSTFKSINDFLSVPRQEITPPVTALPTTTVVRAPSNEKNDSKSRSSHHKKRVNKKPKSTKSDVDSGNAGPETGPSVSSYNSYMSTEHEPMIE